MRTLILDGTGPGEAPPVLGVLKDECRRRGWKSEVVRTSGLDVSPCLGCFNCWVKTPGECVIHDDAGEVTRKFVCSDMVVLLTPVTFGGYSSHLKAVLDRSLGIMLPYFTKIGGRVHHKRRYSRYPGLAVLGTLPSPDEGAEEVFRALAARNAVNAHAPAFAVDVVTGKMGGGAVKKRVTALLDGAGGGRG